MNRLGLLVCLLLSAVARAAEVRSCEMRIQPSWTAADVRAQVGHVADMGMNAVRLEVFYHGGTIYPSRVMAKWKLPAIRPDFQDRPTALREAIAEAHRRGIAVYAWVETFYVWNETLGAGNPILTKYPQWSVRTRDGKMAPVNGEKAYRFVSPANLEARRFLRELYEEIARTGVDGFLIDYLRYPVGSLGPEGALSYDAASVRRAKAELGLDIAKIPLDAKDPDFRRWTDWRIRQTTDFAKELGRALKAINPKLVVAASVHPYPGDPRTLDTLRDWPRWYPEIRVFSPQYYTDEAGVREAYARDRAALPAGGDLWPNILAADIAAGSPVLLWLRQQGVFGISHWAYHLITDADADALRRGPYGQPAP